MSPKSRGSLNGEVTFKAYSRLSTLANGKIKQMLSSTGASPRKVAETVSVDISKELRSDLKCRRLLHGKCCMERCQSSASRTDQLRDFAQRKQNISGRTDEFGASFWVLSTDFLDLIGLGCVLPGAHKSFPIGEVPARQEAWQDVCCIQAQVIDGETSWHL